jgi:hypothetical protein
MATTGLPEFREWSIAAVRLLQGAVYAGEPRVWDIVLSAKSHLEGYFGRLGLLFVVDESEGLAYLRQVSDDELPDGYDGLPKLFRKTRLSYDATLLCVLLREELRRFEEEDVHRCAVDSVGAAGRAQLQRSCRGAEAGPRRTFLYQGSLRPFQSR